MDDSQPLLANNGSAPKQQQRQQKQQQSCFPFLRRSLFGKMFKPRRPMSDNERISLTWLEKWRKFGRFPWKLLVNAIITVLISTSISVQSAQDTPYVVSTVVSFYEGFFPEDFDVTGTEQQEIYGYGITTSIWYLFTVEDVRSSLERAVTNYYKWGENNVGFYRYHSADYPDSSNASLLQKPVPPVLTVTTFADGGLKVLDPLVAATVNTAVESNDFKVSPTDLGPLNVSDALALREFFINLVDMKLTLHLFNTHVIGENPVEHRWEIQLLWDFTERGGRIGMSLSVKKSERLYSVAKLFTFTDIVLDAILIFLCSLSTFLYLKSVRKAVEFYLETKRRCQHRWHNHALRPHITKWRDLPLGIKLRFFSWWFLFGVSSNVCIITGAVLHIISTLGESTYTFEQSMKLSLGLGCLFAWIHMVRYIQFNRKYYALISTLGKSMPNVCRFLIGALPVFIGYCFFGVLYFSSSTARFASFDEAAVTLFSMQNGDDLQNTFRATNDFPIVSRVYFYSFLFVAVFAITNIFIAIIEDSYFSVKEEEEKRNTKLDEGENTVDDDDRDRSEGDDNTLWANLLGVHDFDSEYESEAELSSRPNSAGQTEQSRLFRLKRQDVL